MNVSSQNPTSDAWSRDAVISADNEKKIARVSVRLLAFVLNCATWIWFVTPIAGISDRYWGGGWRYLTMWILTLNLSATALALLSEFGSKKVNQTLVSICLTSSTTLAFTYWGLYLFDPQLLYKGGVSLPTWVEFHAHLFSGLFILAEAPWFSPCFVRMKPIVIGLVVFSLGYGLWSEFVIPAMNTAPCNVAGDVCGFAYPFLNELSPWIRNGFNVGCTISLVSVAAFWQQVLGRRWELRMPGTLRLILFK